MSEKDWEKRAREIIPGMGQVSVPLDKFGELFVGAALKLGGEMADARAEEIAHACARHADLWAADVALATITKPKTREQVLEEALREIVDGDTWTISCATAVARKALDWKPE
jgi:hypothetical protein